jgi:hypothetical protein
MRGKKPMWLQTGTPVPHCVMVDRPCFPHRFSPGSHPVLVLLVRSGLQNFSHTQGPEHGGRFEPLAPVFELGNGKHRVIRPLHRPPAFEEQVQPREMQADRSSGRRHIHPWVLYRIRIHREPVQPRKSIVAVLARKHFAVGGPTARRRQHVFMRRAVDHAKLDLASYATHG